MCEPLRKSKSVRNGTDQSNLSSFIDVRFQAYVE